MKTKQLFNAAKKTLPNALAGGAGTILAAVIANKIVPDTLPNIDSKYVGPGLFVLGVLGEIMFPKNELIKNFAKGISSYSILYTAGAFMPEMKETYGLAGIGEMDFPVIDYNTVEQRAMPLQSYENMDGLGENNDEGDDYGLMPDNNQMFNNPQTTAAVYVPPGGFPTRSLNPGNNLNGNDGYSQYEDKIAELAFNN